MNQNITEVRVAEICEANALSETDIYNLYIDARIDLRKKHSGQECVDKAIEKVGNRLQIDMAESALFYRFLYKKYAP